MPRKPLLRVASHPYHVTNRVNNKAPFPLPLAEVWIHFLETLMRTKRKFPFVLHNFVLMNNHYHLMIQTPELNLDKIMHHFNMQLSRRIALSASRINRIFGARYKWSLIYDESYYLNVYKYIYQNPMRAGLVKDVHEYPFSSLSPLTKKYGLYDYQSEDFSLRDLNTSVARSDCEGIRKGLQKTIFKPVFERNY